MSEEQPHDWLFKEIFSVPEHAASHLRSVLPAELVARIEWDSLTVENTRLHISGLDAKEADVLLRAQLAGKPALLYVVFEHQSSEDTKMPLRMLRYVVGIWSEYVKLHPATRTLPPVIPCVLHHGPNPWKSPTDVAAMVDVDDETRALLGPLIPSMRFLLDDLTALEPDQLNARSSSAAVRLTLHAFHRFATTTDPVGEMLRLRDLNRDLLAADSGPQVLSAVLWYLSPATEALMTAAQRIAEEARQEAYANSLIKLLTHRFKQPVPATELARIRSASAAELETWTDRALEAETLDEVLR